MKPYQKKYRPKAGKKNTLWTDADLDLLRTLYLQGESIWDISVRLDRSRGAIYQRIYLMKQRDKAEKYVHVSDTLTTEDATYDVSSQNYTSILKRVWNWLFGREN